MAGECHQGGGPQRFLGSVQVQCTVGVAQRAGHVSPRQCALGLLTAVSRFPLDGQDAVQLRSASVALRPGLVLRAAGGAVRHGLLDVEQDLGQISRHLVRLLAISLLHGLPQRRDQALELFEILGGSVR